MTESNQTGLIKWVWRLPHGWGRMGVLLFVLGFLAMVGGAIKEWGTVGSGIAIVALGLASISVGIGFISVSAAYKSDKQKETTEGSGDSVTKKEKKTKRIEWYALALPLGIGLLVIGISCFGIGLYYSNLTAISVGLAFASVGLGSVAIWLGVESKKQMKAMAKLDVCEKIAIMYAQTGDREKRIEWDGKAALELKQWVEPELWREFEKAKQNLLDSLRDSDQK